MKRARLGIGPGDGQGLHLGRVRRFLQDGALDELELRRQILQSKLTTQSQMYVCAACLKPFMYSAARPSKTTARKHCRVFHQTIMDQIENENPSDIPETAPDAMITFRKNPLLGGSQLHDGLRLMIDRCSGDDLEKPIDDVALLGSTPVSESLLRDIHKMMRMLCSAFGVLPKNLEHQNVQDSRTNPNEMHRHDKVVDSNKDAQLIDYLVSLSDYAH